MSVLDDLIENLVERNIVKLNGAITVGLVEDGIKVKGEIGSTIKEKQKRGDPKLIASLVVPVGAKISIREFKIPIPELPVHGSTSSSSKE